MMAVVWMWEFGGERGVGSGLEREIEGCKEAVHLTREGTGK